MAEFAPAQSAGPRERTRRAAIHTLGCRLNQSESGILMDLLRREGYEIVPFGEPADLGIVHTCTVTREADAKSRQLIRSFIRANPQAYTAVIGCYAQTGYRALAGIDGIDLICGNQEKLNLLDFVAQGKNATPLIVRDRLQRDDFTIAFAGDAPMERRANLKIQDGCNARCSYCIVPSARGPSRSMQPGDVLENISALVGAGYREIVLTGVHLGAWGADLVPPRGLPSLLRQIEESCRIGRLRLSSIEPLEVTEELIEGLRGSRLLCPHLHIPLQSGDDRVLSAMGRHYGRQFFRDLVNRLVSEIPDLAIGVDVMAGFPGEKDGEFENTAELLRELPVAYLHVFPYSERPGTLAASMPGKIGAGLRAERAAALRALGLAKREEFARRAVGTRQTVLVEGSRDRKTGRLKGFTGNYIPVLLAGESRDLMNRLVDVVIESAEAGTVNARIRHDP